MFAASKSGSVDAKDAQFKNVTMLLHGNGTNGAQNNTFVDSSTNNFTITRNGNTTQGTFTPYGSNWSNYFDGSSAKVTLSSSAAMNLDAQFTIECWVYWNGTSLYYQNFVGSNDTFTSNASFFRVWGTSAPVNANKIGIGNQTHDGSSSVFSTNNLVANKWNHVAATRDSSNIIRVFINGTLEKTGSTDSSVYNFGQGGTCIGDSPWDGAQGWYSGYISNLRIIKGSCLYTSSFTPSTTPLTAVTNTSLLVCQSNRFIDNSTNAFTLTVSGSPSVQRFSPFSPTTAYSTSVIGGSGYFDGSVDSLSVATTTALSFGTGDFTIEGWVYKTAAANASFVDGRVNPGGAAPWAFYVDASNYPYFYDGSVYSSSVAISLNAWNHIVAVRTSGTLKIFVNGVQGYSAALSTNLDRSAGAFIGVSANTSSPSAYWQGYINDLRIVKGTAVYTAAFTPPTAPLTAITNTQLLLSCTNAGILDNAMMNDLETVGNAQISTSVKKYGTGSMAFDGTGDYLTAPSNAYFAIGATEDYTVECWVNFSVVQTCGFYQATNNISSATGQFWFGYEGGQLKSSQHGSSTYAVGYTWSPSTGTWYHVAATRASGTVRLFINGTVVTTNTTTQNGVSFTQSGAAVGVLTTPSYMNGYIDDLRITKGVARYTASFTVPSSAFPDKG